MNSKKNQSNQFSHSINLADKDLIAVSQINGSHQIYARNDSNHQITSTSSILD
jgi:hypothetical protein